MELEQLLNFFDSIEGGSGSADKACRDNEEVEQVEQVEQTGRLSGVVERFEKQKGFGAIRVDGTGEVLFAHWSQIRSSDIWPALTVGMTVMFDKGFDKGKDIAMDITDADGSPIGNIEEMIKAFRDLSNFTCTGTTVSFDRWGGSGQIALDEPVSWIEELPAGSLVDVTRDELVVDKGAPSCLYDGMKVKFKLFKNLEREGFSAAEVYHISGRPIHQKEEWEMDSDPKGKGKWGMDSDPKGKGKWGMDSSPKGKGKGKAWSITTVTNGSSDGVVGNAKATWLEKLAVQKKIQKQVPERAPVPIKPKLTLLQQSKVAKAPAPAPAPGAPGEGSVADASDLFLQYCSGLDPAMAKQMYDKLDQMWDVTMLQASKTSQPSQPSQPFQPSQPSQPFQTSQTSQSSKAIDVNSGVNAMAGLLTSLLASTPKKEENKHMSLIMQQNRVNRELAAAGLGSQFARPPSKYLCVFFANGTCDKGSLCTFSHDLETAEVPRLQPCKFFRQGICAKGVNCPFPHDAGSDGPAPILMGTVGTTLCKFFQLGRCTKGSACPFSHGVDGF